MKAFLKSAVKISKEDPLQLPPNLNKIVLKLLIYLNTKSDRRLKRFSPCYKL
jgi:hypothetical protein